MGWLEYPVSCMKITIPIIILLLFPTFLNLLTKSPTSWPSFSSSSSSTPTHLLSTTQDQENQASHALLNPPSSPTMKRKKEVAMVRRIGQVEKSLLRARAAIRRTFSGCSNDNSTTRASGSCLSATEQKEMSVPRIYRNPKAFYRSYIEMEKRMKVYVYEEGEVPLVHDGPCKNIYSIEGRFIGEFEMKGGGGGLRTRDPSKAHVFFLPFSVSWMVRYVYNSSTHSYDDIKRFVADYVRIVSSKHPYWNRTAGADHFMLSCHDWGPAASSANPELYHNSMRALCNANTSEGFRPHKDVSIPEINLVTGDYPKQLRTPPPPTAHRPYLAFFAGGLHGPIRPVLLQHWEGKDPNLQVHQYLPKGVKYFEDYILKSRFCLCPSGYEVASPRIVEAILAECVPVLISQGYYAPFSDVLRWEAFSVSVEMEEIPRLKEILSGISEEEIERLREGLRGVRRHFLLDRPVKRFDVFHMILHSVWLRRLNLRVISDE